MKNDFVELGKINGWRKQLSNFYTKTDKDKKIEPLFELDGYKWASVEHYYHANKFKKNNLDYYKAFQLMPFQPPQLKPLQFHQEV